MYACIYIHITCIKYILSGQWLMKTQCGGESSEVRRGSNVVGKGNGVGTGGLQLRLEGVSRAGRDGIRISSLEGS